MITQRKQCSFSSNAILLYFLRYKMFFSPVLEHPFEIFQNCRIDRKRKILDCSEKENISSYRINTTFLDLGPFEG